MTKKCEPVNLFLIRCGATLIILSSVYLIIAVLISVSRNWNAEDTLAQVIVMPHILWGVLLLATALLATTFGEVGRLSLHRCPECGKRQLSWKTFVISDDLSYPLKRHTHIRWICLMCGSVDCQHTINPC